MMVSFIKENTYFASYPYEVFLYLKYQQSTKSCACDKSHWQNILRVCQPVRERSHASPDMACYVFKGFNDTFQMFFLNNLRFCILLTIKKSEKYIVVTSWTGKLVWHTTV